MSVWRAVAMGAALLSILVLGACTEDKSAPEPEKAVTSSDVKKEFGEAVQTLKDYTYAQRQEYYRKVTEEINGIDAKIDALKEDIKTKSDEVKESIEERIERLRERQSAARERLEEMMESSENAWNEMKEGMQKALDEVKDAYKNAAGELS